MNRTEDTCSLERIDDYLEERLSESELLMFESHLTKCKSCQEELENRAAEPDVWRDATQLLGHDGSSSLSSLTDGTDDGKYQLRLASVLASLSPTDDPDMLGRIGDYEISGIVGIGGMGAVLKGFDKSLRRVVAIKIMAPHLADSGSARNRFRREARAAAAITHDNVIDIYGVSEENELPYLVMPYARGPSLQVRIDESGPLTAIEVVRIGRQIAAGLAAAHEQGLVHRDIKPANILLNKGIERLWITDFGVARAIDDASMTQTGLIAGTPQYMSPEQARGDTVDHRSDLFSLGSILYTACTGHPPFRSEAAYGILRRITDTDPRPIGEISPEIPPWLCEFIERLMAKHPADRFQTAKEVAELLEGCLAHLQQPMQVDLPPCVTPRKQADDFAQVSTRQRHSAELLESSRVRLPRKGIWVVACLLMSIGLGSIAFQMTAPVDVSGQWSGEDWQNVTLSSVEEASDWYTGGFTDHQGRRGALHLEWSRLQRRYNGRWKVGDDQAGTITLRESGKSEVRGAIFVDPESPIAANKPRLREFVWKVAAADHVLPDQDSITPRGQAILAPVKGTIVRFGDGVSENSPINKGDLIAQINVEDPELRDRIARQLDLSKQELEAASAVLKGKEQELDAVGASVEAAESQVVYHEQVKEQTEISSKAAVASKQDHLKAEEQLLASRQSSLTAAQHSFDRKKKLHEEGLVAEKELQEAEEKLNNAKSIAQMSKQAVKGLENELTVKQSEGNLKVLKAKANINNARAEWRQVLLRVTKIESEIERARAELKRAEIDVAKWQEKLARSSIQDVRAPGDGLVTSLTKNKILRAGESICVIMPPVTSQQRDGEAAAQDSVNTSDFSFEPLEKATKLSRISGETVSESFNNASALSQRFRDLQELVQIAKTQETTKQLRESITELERELAAAESERKAAIEELQAQLEEARELEQSQQDLSVFVKQRVEMGEMPALRIRQAEQAAEETMAEIQQLELLLEYYTKLGQPTPISAEDDRQAAREILQVQLEAGKKRLRSLTEQCKIAKLHFEQGQAEIDEVVKAKQAESKAAGEVRRIESLLKRYSGLPESDTKPED